MPTVEHVIELPVSGAVCFEYIDTPDNIPRFMFGVKSFEFLAPAEPRLGARFVSHVQLGPIKLVLNGHICEYVENRIIGLSLDEGLITGTVVWGVMPVEGEQCSATVEIRYQIGSGLTGRALSKVIDSILEPAIKHTESKLREQVTAQHRAGAAD